MFENDYTLTGKHATHLKYLAKKNSGDDTPDGAPTAKLFERYIDVYMNAAVWGLLYSRREPKDTSSNDRARIYADAFSTERENCVFLYRLVMLLDESVELSSEERLDRAFRYDALPEKSEEYKKNMELFHEYVRGGIEMLFEKFTDGCITSDDYLNRVYEVVSTFKKKSEGATYEDEIAALIR